MLDNARKYLTVLNSAGEHGTALDSAIEHDIDTMGTITYYNFSDVTMSHYGKFLSLLMNDLIPFIARVFRSNDRDIGAALLKKNFDYHIHWIEVLGSSSYSSFWQFFPPSFWSRAVCSWLILELERTRIETPFLVSQNANELSFRTVLVIEAWWHCHFIGAITWAVSGRQ